jgi:large subunit ribosomal protein L22
MEVKATARHIRMSPRKVRLVIDVIRGMGLAQARSQLHVMKKAAAEPVLKLLESAAANATHNFNLDASQMYVKSITADGGPVLGRWRARAFGRAAPIRKRTTHIAITLDSRESTSSTSAN